MGHRAVPEELLAAIRAGLPPRARATFSRWNPENRSWWFEIVWATRLFELGVSEVAWGEGRIDVIRTRAGMVAPRPEATLGGHQFHLALQSSGDLLEESRFIFALYRSQGEFPRLLTVRVAGAQAHCGRDPEDCRLATALIGLKDRIDDGSEESTAIVLGCPCGPLMRDRKAVSAVDARRYADLKLREAYRMTRRIQQVRFSWTDFAYLGLTEEEFLGIVRERDRQDWLVDGTSLSPTLELWESWPSRLASSIG